jgi:hypothetical protein
MIPLFIFLFGLILVWRTGTAGLLNLGDSLFPFFPPERLRQLLYVWNDHNILGKDDTALVSQLPWSGLAALLDKIGVPLWLINRLWFVLPFLLLGLAMSFLSGVIFGREKKISRLIATLFFMFNPFTLNLVSGSNILTLSFAAGVFVFGLFVRGLEKEKVEFRDVVLLGLSSVLAAANLVVLVMMLLLCFFYLLFFTLVNRRNRPRLRRALLYSSFLILYSLFVNSWWLLPFVSQVLHPGYFSTLFASGTDVGTLEFTAQFTSLFDVARLFYGMAPTANFSISHYYHYLLAPTMMMVLVTLIFVVSLFRKKTKWEVFFLVLAWVSVILASGTRPPFGFVYQFLWDHIPYFHIFRTTNRFNLWTMISYSILLGFLYQHLKEFFTKHHRRPFILYSLFFILTSIFLTAWPLLSGNIYGQLQPHQIPDDYYQLREFLQQQEGDFRVLSLPFKDWLTPYSWSAPFDMQEILIDFSSKDVVVNTPGYLLDLMNRDIREDDPIYAMVYLYPQRPEALDALRLMGVRFVVVHRDYMVIWGDYYPVEVDGLEEVLEKTEWVSFLKSFGDLDVYEVEGFYPRVYASVEGQTLGQGLTLDYQKISPVEYRVQIKDATEPFTLVLTENFHPGWESSLGKHIKFADFANGWKISPEDYRGGEIVLKYGPQRLFKVGLVVSGLSLLGGLVYYVAGCVAERSWRA